MSTAGKRMLSALVERGETTTFFQHREYRRFLTDGESELFDQLEDFAQRYGKLPSPQTVRTDMGTELVDVAESPAYYADAVEKRYIHNGLKQALQHAADHLGGAQGSNPDKALEIATNAVMELQADKQSNAITAFERSGRELISEIKERIFVGIDGIKFGWPYLDNITGGIMAGDMVSMVGMTGSGKTWLAIYNALTAWATGKRVLFISMEMPAERIRNRAAAMHAGVDPSKINRGKVDTWEMEHLSSALSESDTPFWIVDGQYTATVDDVHALARQMQPDLCVVDGAYLLKHPTEHDRYKRVAENADLLVKKVSPHAPVISTWQFKREVQEKLKKKEDPEVEDIGYAYAAAQNATVAIGIVAEESVEGLAQRRLVMMKGREGESGQFRVNWNFQKMDLSEIETEEQLTPTDLTRRLDDWGMYALLMRYNQRKEGRGCPYRIPPMS